MKYSPCGRFQGRQGCPGKQDRLQLPGVQLDPFSPGPSGTHPLRHYNIYRLNSLQDYIMLLLDSSSPSLQYRLNSLQDYIMLLLDSSSPSLQYRLNCLQDYIMLLRDSSSPSLQYRLNCLQDYIMLLRNASVHSLQYI